jgi:hypothetical protein
LHLINLLVLAFQMRDKSGDIFCNFTSNNAKILK